MRSAHATRKKVEQPVNDNYMAVIRESHASLLSKHDLSEKRRKILSLELDPNMDSRTWNNMKRLVRESQTQRK